MWPELAEDRTEVQFLSHSNLTFGMFEGWIELQCCNGGALVGWISVEYMSVFRCILFRNSPASIVFQ